MGGILYKWQVSWVVAAGWFRYRPENRHFEHGWGHLVNGDTVGLSLFFYRVKYVYFSHLLCFMRVNILNVFRPPDVWVGRRKHCLGSLVGQRISLKVTSRGSFFVFVFSFILFWSVAPCETGLFLPIRLRCDMLFFGIGSIHYDGIGGKSCGEQMEQPKFTPECCAVVYWSIFCFAFWAEMGACVRGAETEGGPATFPSYPWWLFAWRKTEVRYADRSNEPTSKHPLR